MMKKRILILLTLACMLLALVGCNARTVQKTSLNDSTHLIVEYSDGTTEDLGYVGEKITAVSKTVNESGHLIVSYSDGTTEDLGKVADLGTAITIVSKTVDENGHLIVTYSDGKTEDLGDVSVLPAQYTVRFLGNNGKVLKTQTVYKGTGATAPSAPSVKNMTFIGWDVDFSNVQSDLDVHALYTDKQTFTVTFVDEDGNVLKTEKVLPGKSATAPNPPTGEDNTVFDRWDTSYTNVTKDLTVQAVYRFKKTLTVTFKDYSGLVLEKVSVEEGSTAAATQNPTRDGYTFIGWSDSLENITANKTVTAQYVTVNGTNVFDISYEIVAKNTVTVTATVRGNVKFAALEGNMTIPSGLTFVSVSEGTDKTVVNHNGNKIYFITTNPTDITSDTVIFKATFTVGSGSSYTLDTTIEDICDYLQNDVDSSVIGEEIKVK